MKWFFLPLLFLAGSLHAEVYKHVNENGEVVYSDKPSAGAKKMDLPELPTYKPPRVPLIRPDNAPLESDVYRSFDFIKPRENSTIRNNLGVIELQMQIDPALKVREKHRIQFYLDNERYGPLVDKTAIIMSNIDRGEHSISASVFDAEGNAVVAAPNITVFVKRESELHTEDRFVPPPPDPDKPPPETPVNPGNREFNPNIRTVNPNIRSPNPNIITPPPTPAPLPSR